MLTIGYGDISPKNPEEKLITIFIEIVGKLSNILRCYRFRIFAELNGSHSLKNEIGKLKYVERSSDYWKNI